MFWESVVTGLGVLVNWQTYVAVLLFLVLSRGPVILGGFILTKAGKAEGAIGCLSMIILPFLQVFALFVFVLTMSPIILGLSKEAAWSLPWVLASMEPWFVAKYVGVLWLATIVFGFIPFAGNLESLQTLLIGIFTLAIVVGVIAANNPELATKHIVFLPGGWFVFGFLVIGLVMVWLGSMLAGLLLAVIGARIEGNGELLVSAIAATFGFLPVFIYGAWLGAQIRAGV
jgi:hypothetical protein